LHRPTECLKGQSKGKGQRGRGPARLKRKAYQNMQRGDGYPDLLGYKRGGGGASNSTALKLSPTVLLTNNKILKTEPKLSSKLTSFVGSPKTWGITGRRGVKVGSPGGTKGSTAERELTRGEDGAHRPVSGG